MQSLGLSIKIILFLYYFYRLDAGGAIMFFNSSSNIIFENTDFFNCSASNYKNSLLFIIL